MGRKSKSSTATASTERVRLDSGKHSVVAQVIGYTKTLVWVRIPYKLSHVVLTLPREWLGWGYAKYKTLQVMVNYDSVKSTEHGWTAKVRIEGGIDRNEAVDA